MENLLQDQHIPQTINDYSNCLELLLDLAVGTQDFVAKR